MKDPNDCSWPHERLCVHDCKMGCRKRKGKPLRTADDLEEEAWNEVAEALNHEGVAVGVLDLILFIEG